jgi:undecaprenyl-diphosphatase
MNWLKSILYGLVSGFAEFLPVSSSSHQAILSHLFGIDLKDPMRELLIHIAVILAFFMASGSLFSNIQRGRRISNARRRSGGYAARGLFDLRLIKTATVPLVICLLLTASTRQLESSLVYIALFSLINGILLIIPEYIRHGNKDARTMTGLDGIMIGLCGSFSVLPGISRIGAIHTYATVRGADKQHSLNWALLLSAPALLVLCGFDIIGIFTASLVPVSAAVLAGYVLSVISAYLGAYGGIIFIRFLTVRSGFTGFAYYSLGVSLFSVILYLIT